MRERTLLIDADVTAYTFSMVAQHEYQWDREEGDDTVSVFVDDINEVWPQVVDHIEKLKGDLKASDVVLCLTDSHNFRKDLLPTYKGTRKTKPRLLPEIRKLMHEQYRTYQRPGLEGDDCMGILATHPTLIKGERIIVSIDKDMKTIPATIYNPGKEEWYRITPDVAHWWHMYQTLTGDRVDEYKGCPGIGPKKAQEALDLAKGTLWEAVVDTYVRRKLTEDDALVQARVAKILTADDYDFKRRRPILWTPK